MLKKRLIDTVKKHPKKTAIVYNNLTISYQELYAKITHLSEHLSTIGITQGDCVALILHNSPEAESLCN